MRLRTQAPQDNNLYTNTVQPLIDLLLVTQLQLARRAVRGLDHDPAWDCAWVPCPCPDLVPKGGACPDLVPKGGRRAQDNTGCIIRYYTIIRIIHNTA